MKSLDTSALLEKGRPDRRVEVIQKNHAFAIAAFELETILPEHDVVFLSRSETHPEVQKRLEGLPDNVRRRFWEALKQYSAQRAEQKRKLAEMEAVIEQEHAYGIPLAEAREKLGEKIFKGIVNDYRRPQKGKITLTAREGYFLLVFESKEDYRAAREAKRGELLTDEDRARIAGSAGSYHHMGVYTRFLPNRYFGPVLMVRGDYDQETVEGIIAHERQHFINHSVFGMFSITEKYLDEDLRAPGGRKRIQGFQAIKDEVLAYIREGKGGIRMQEALFGELYEHLFKNLDPQDETEARSIIGTISQLLSRRASVRQSPEACAILVYQLAHVPLARFPEWLSALEGYYFARFDLLDDFDTSVSISEYPMERIDLGAVIQRRYPSQYQRQATQVAGQAQTLVEQLKGIRQQAQEVVFNHTLTLDAVREKLQAIEKSYKETKARFWVLYAPLIRNGALAPAGLPPRSYEYGEDVGSGQDDDSDYLLTVQHKVLNALNDYPQSEIDTLADYFDRKGDVEAGKRAEKRLTTFIKKIVHELNHHRPCWVTMDQETALPHTFFVSVDFRVSPEENKRGVKGAELIFEMHSSKTSQ